jgi:hypothetical protein
MQGLKPLQPISLNAKSATPRPPGTHDTPLHNTNTNQLIGDELIPLPTNKILRVYHQNIRGAKTYNEWDKWSDAMK